MVLVVRNPPADTENMRHGLIPVSGRSPEEEYQYSGLENPTDRGAWWLQSMESQRVGHDWAAKTSTPVFLPGE